MSNKDLTILYLTNNELPDDWIVYQRRVLFEAIKDADLINISRRPMNGMNIIQTEEKSSSNVYWQMLKGCKVAETKYIAIAEDDTLYHSEHYSFRPSKGEFGYNKSHWSLFTWGEPVYNWRDRQGNYTLIANRLDALDALTERFEKYPYGIPSNHVGEIGRTLHEKHLGLKLRKAVDFSTKIAVVNFNHIYGLDDRQRRHRKGYGSLLAYDIPYWGKASELVKKFK
jgi:hypothetical protein